MTAYPKVDLYNKYLQQQASEAFLHECINEETYKSILEKHAHNLYTPNYFIRIGLALLTVIAVILSLALLWLIISADSDEAIIGLLIFFALTCYALLEAMVRLKKYYNAGIDNILLVMIVIFIVSALLVNNFNSNYEVTSLIALIICVWLSVRFADSFMTILSFASLILFFFFVYIKLGTFGKLTAPFALMILCVAIFLVAKKFISKQNLVIYKNCCKWVMLLSLTCFYAAGNYYVVNELSISIFGMPASFGFVFWIFTFLVPVAYIIYGLRKKENLFYRTGIILFIVSVLTFRYYYAVMPAEVAMTVFGILLILLSYVLIKYLKTPHNGFTFANIDQADKNLINTEALIIAQAFGKRAIPANDQFQFGGGSSGGGGATGNY